MSQQQKTQQSDAIVNDSCEVMETGKNPDIKGAINDIDAALEASKDTTTKISVLCGAYMEEHPIVGMSIADVRSSLKAEANIAEGAICYNNGEEVKNENYIVKKGDYLEFIKEAGVKG